MSLIPFITRPLVVLPLLIVGGMVFFFIWPTLDLSVSRLFYDAESGVFPLAYDPTLRVIQLAVQRFSLLWSIFLLVSLALLSLRTPKITRLMRHFPISRLHLLFLIITLAIGPGLVVHAILKDGFGRPRPEEVQEFGGQQTYMAPFVISQDHGQSFVSGHAAMGFYLCALAWVVPARYRRITYIGGVAAGLLIGACRMMQGRHFLSDVLFSGLIVLLLIHMIDRLFKRYAARNRS